MGNAVVKTADGQTVTVLEQHEELLHRTREKLLDLTGSEIVAMDLLARLEAAVIDTMEAAKIRARERQGLFTFALNQFLVDPKADE